MSSSEEQRLLEEIEQLRTELGETVAALAHKANLPARAKERGNKLAQQAVERGTALQGQLIERGVELSVRVIAWSNELKAQAIGGRSELRDQAIDAVRRGREGISQESMQQWVKLTGAGIALIAMVVLVRRALTS